MEFQTKIMLESKADVSFTLVEDLSTLMKLVPRWRELLSTSRSPELFLDPEWMLLWWKHYGADRQLAFGFYYIGDVLIALSPFCLRQYRYLPGLSLRRLEYLGSSLGEADGVWPVHLSPIVREGFEKEAAAAIARTLDDGSFGNWHECVLEMMDGDSPLLADLQLALEKLGTPHTIDETDRAPYLILPRDWDAFLATINKKNRHYFRRAIKKFEQWVSERDHVYREAFDESARREGMQILHDLHTERWTTEGKSGAFASQRFIDFHEDYSRRMLESQRLKLVWITVEDKPLAATYAFLGDDKVCLYQAGRKMDLPNDLAIGIVLLKHVVEDAMANGYREFDFLNGNSYYKRQFTETAHSLVALRLMRPGIRGSLVKLANKARRYAIRGKAILSRGASAV